MPVTHLSLVQGLSPDPKPPLTMPDGSRRFASGFGTYGLDESQPLDPLALQSSPRVAELQFRASFFQCKQHDHKCFDWSGVLRMSATQPLMGSTGSSQFVPLDDRMPSAPYRLARKIVFSFTGMLFGQGRWPQMRSRDADTQAAAEQLVESSALAARAIHGRNLAGACGTAGLSWQFVDGLPRTEAHAGQDIHVLTWFDKPRAIPAHVVELKQESLLAIDPTDGQLRPRAFWQRRDWTLTADVSFLPVPVNPQEGEDSSWRIDERASHVHGDDECHFVWVQNLPPEDGTDDGACDYAETYVQQNGLDVLNSVSTNGVKLNGDPTVVLVLGEEQEAPTVIRKGSDNAIVMKKGGSASYLQLQDTAALRDSVDQQRQQILEVCECVVLDPDKAAAAAASGEAQRLVYAPMLNKTDVLRMQWGPAIASVVNQMLRSWRRLRTTPLEVPDENGVEVLNEETGEVLPPTREVDQDLFLPERVIKDGDEQTFATQNPGQGEVTVEWGPYFKPSGVEKQAITASLGAAAGGRPVLSQRAAVELAANLLDRDAGEEWRAVQEEAEAVRANDAAAFSGAEPGDEPVAVAAGGDLAPTDKIKAMTANEVRGKMGLGPMRLPDGSPDPDGEMKWIAYLAKLEAQGEVEGQAQGEENAGVITPDDDLPRPVSAPLIPPTPVE